MWDHIDQFYILTVKDSPRIKCMEEKIKELFIPENKLTWNVVPRLNCNNCLLCSACENHVLAYKDAYSKGYNNIIIFEDDIMINGEINNLEKQVDYFLKKYLSYDILYFGNIPYNIINTFNDSGIIKSKGIFCHAYLINKRLFSKFIDINIPYYVFYKYAEKNNFLTLTLPAFKGFGTDFWLYFESKESYCIYPMCIIQDNFLNKVNNKTLLKCCYSLIETYQYNKKIIIYTLVSILLLGNLI